MEGLAIAKENTLGADRLETLQRLWTKFVENKRLCLDIAQIQEEVQDQKVQVKWVNSESMLADCLSKRNAKADTLMEVLKTGKMPSQSN